MSPVLVGVAAYLIALAIALGFMVALGRAAKYADEIENRGRREALQDRDHPGVLVPFGPRPVTCSEPPVSRPTQRPSTTSTRGPHPRGRRSATRGPRASERRSVRTRASGSAHEEV